MRVSILESVWLAKNFILLVLKMRGTSERFLVPSKMRRMNKSSKFWSHSWDMTRWDEFKKKSWQPYSEYLWQPYSKFLWIFFRSWPACYSIAILYPANTLVLFRSDEGQMFIARWSIAPHLLPLWTDHQPLENTCDNWKVNWQIGDRESSKRKRS